MILLNIENMYVRLYSIHFGMFVYWGIRLFRYSYSIFEIRAPVLLYSDVHGRFAYVHEALANFCYLGGMSYDDAIIDFCGSIEEMRGPRIFVTRRWSLFGLFGRGASDCGRLVSHVYHTCRRFGISEF